MKGNYYVSYFYFNKHLVFSKVYKRNLTTKRQAEFISRSLSRRERERERSLAIIHIFTFVIACNFTHLCNYAIAFPFPKGLPVSLLGTEEGNANDYEWSTILNSEGGS